jgi:hypothetical protein
MSTSLARRLLVVLLSITCLLGGITTAASANVPGIHQLADPCDGGGGGGRPA